MFRKPSGAILCPRCGRLTHPDAAECLVCGLPRPGRWMWASGISRVLRTGNVTGVITVACIALYVASLIIDPAGLVGGRGPLDFLSMLSPSGRALATMGASGALPWHQGRWWTVFTASFLHGGIFHILFNVLWIRQLGPALEELYGRSRLVIIFVLSGALGFFTSSMVGVLLTVGASASIFGLLGAMVAYGKKRGGTFGKMVLREYGLWAAILFAFGLMPGTGVDNWAHAGGFVGGFLAGLLLSFSERRTETTMERGLATALIAMTVIAFCLALGTAFLG